MSYPFSDNLKSILAEFENTEHGVKLYNIRGWEFELQKDSNNHINLSICLPQYELLTFDLQQSLASSNASKSLDIYINEIIDRSITDVY